MHEIDKIEYSRGCSVNFCEYSILIFYLVVFFSEWEADGNFLTRVSGSEKYSIFHAVGIMHTNAICWCSNITGGPPSQDMKTLMTSLIGWQYPACKTNCKLDLETRACKSPGTGSEALWLSNLKRDSDSQGPVGYDWIQIQKVDCRRFSGTGCLRLASCSLMRLRHVTKLEHLSSKYLVNRIRSELLTNLA